MNLAFIPARKGSKRIPGKNKKMIFGQPIIQYPIKQCLKSHLFEKIIVSTDDKDIVDISIKNQVSVYKRKKYCDDNAILSDVLYEYLTKVRVQYKFVFLIYCN